MNLNLNLNLKLNLILLFCLLPSACCLLNAQHKLSVAPMSVETLGGTPEVGILSYEYNTLGIHYLHVYDSKYYIIERASGGKISRGKTRSTPAVSWVPVKIIKVFRLGGILSARPFPTGQASRFNIWAEAGFNIGSVRLSYIHISNGFGILNDVNPGLDTFRVTVSLN